MVGCGEAEKRPKAEPSPKVEVRPQAALIFPKALEVDDPAVNAFVTRAMSICASRYYEDFRLLWSAREDPMSREEFEESWNAVKDIHIRAVRKAKLAGLPKDESDDSAIDSGAAFVGPPPFGAAPSMPVSAKPDNREPQVVYLVAAEVALDPTHRAAARNPKREVVLLLIREHGDWKLARATKAMRSWIKEQIDGPFVGPPSNAASATASRP